MYKKQITTINNINNNININNITRTKSSNY